MSNPKKNQQQNKDQTLSIVVILIETISAFISLLIRSALPLLSRLKNNSKKK